MTVEEMREELLRDDSGIDEIDKEDLKSADDMTVIEAYEMQYATDVVIDDRLTVEEMRAELMDENSDIGSEIDELDRECLKDASDEDIIEIYNAHCDAQEELEEIFVKEGV